MKRTKLWISASLALLLLIGGFSTAMAFMGHNMGAGDCQGKNGENMPMNRHLEKMTDFLELTKDQQTKIQTIMTAHHEQSGQHHESMQQVHAAISQQKGKEFNESEVRRAAEQGNAAQTEMMVSRAKMQNDIYAVLTAEQQKLFDKVELMCGDRSEGRHGGKHHGGEKPGAARHCN